jgi:hypothetical protein
MMTKKASGDIRLMAQGPSFERAAWLATMLRIANARAMADPSDDDKQEMRAAIGDNQTFARLLDADKDHLFSAMLTVRHRLQIYDELVKFEEEDPSPLLSALTVIVAVIPNHHGVLSEAADEMSDVGKTTVGEAWQKIVEFANTAELLRDRIRNIAAKPRVYDKRTIRSRRQRHEAVMIRDCLKLVGVDLRKTGPDEYGREGDEGLKLAVRIVHYTSGQQPGLHAFRTRLSRASSL